VIDDLIDGWRDMDAALPDYEEAEAYFEGTVPEVFASTVARQAIEATGQRYRFNLAKTPVTVRVDRVELAAVTVPDDEFASAVIEDVWDANGMAVHYPDLFRQVFEYGDAYLMEWPVDDDEPDPRLRAAGVELTVHNPKCVRVFYDPEHPRRKVYAIKRWALKRGDGRGKAWRADVHYPDSIERWETKPGGDPAKADGWLPYLDDDQDLDDWLLENPTGRIRFTHYRTAEPYGRPVHAAAYSPQDAVNKLLITQLTTTDSHGWPQRYALTDKGADLDVAGDTPDWDDDLDGDDTVDGNRAGTSSQLKSGPGTIMDLVGKRAVGQFEAAQPSVFLEPAAFYVRLMAQMTNTPLHYFDPSGSIPSGESLKVADAPLTKDIEHLEAMLLAPVTETWTAVLDQRAVDVARVDVRWAPVETAAGASDWETARLQQDVGVPRHQTLIERGYEAEQVEAWHADEAEAMDMVRRVELMGAVGDAIQRLGVGVSTGVLSHDQAMALMARVMGDTMGEDDGGTRGPGPAAQPPAAAAGDTGAREVAEMIQKLYLGVGVIISADEARDILNRDGAGLTGPPPEPRSQWATRDGGAT
jgi:hypothetical protein